VKEQPLLETGRLLLRPLMAQDDLSVRELANDLQIARMSLWSMCGSGRKTCRYWINGTHESWECGSRAEFAIELKSGGVMVGLAGLEAVSAQHAPADLTFLLKVPFWGQGYATEAASAVVWFGFKRLKLNRICATYLRRNTASGQVLAKLGMAQEGVLRQAVRRGDKFEDAVMVSLLRKEWAAQAVSAGARSQMCKCRIRRQASPPGPRPTVWLFPHESSHMASKLPVGGPPGPVGVRPGEGPGRTAVRAPG
jgi:[ribosomal protein S5]-alanine N-acetyltransferase